MSARSIHGDAGAARVSCVGLHRACLALCKREDRKRAQSMLGVLQKGGGGVSKRKFVPWFRLRFRPRIFENANVGTTYFVSCIL